MKFAAIDIGSNAIRLLFQNVYETDNGPVFYKDEIVRVPLRLGEEAFTLGHFSKQKIDLLVKTMEAMRNLIEVHNVNAYRAVATSAMRDAANGKEVIAIIKNKTGINIEIISGDEESKFILQYPLQQSHLNPLGAYYYIDVGGGSTELAIISNGKLLYNKSFNIGTLRILNNQVTDNSWKEMMLWLQSYKTDIPEIAAIGVGGNINKVMKMYGKTGKMFITLGVLKRVATNLQKLTLTERMIELGLKPDRADVIIPALKIYIHVMKWAGLDKIYIPKQGLSDGIISQVYLDYKNAHNSVGNKN